MSAKDFREAVLARAECERCGTQQARMHAHHLVPRSRAPGWSELHNPEVNGACLCAKCHDLIHFDTPDDRDKWIRRPPSSYRTASGGPGRCAPS